MMTNLKSKSITHPTAENQEMEILKKTPLTLLTSGNVMISMSKTESIKSAPKTIMNMELIEILMNMSKVILK